MARARNIKPGFFKNEDLGTADPFVSLLFAGLWTLADKAGILEDRPLRIKAELFPYRDCFDINGYLTVLVSFNLIHRYEVDGVKLIQIENFVKHQNPHHTDRDSEYPSYSDSCRKSVKQPLINGDAPADSLIPSSLIPDNGFPSKDLSAPSAQTVSKKGTSLPADWFLPKEWGEWALSEQPTWSADDVRRVAADFKDHWLANANQAKAKKADWLATWRKWVRSPLNAIKPPTLKQSEAGNEQAREGARARLFGGAGNATA